MVLMYAITCHKAHGLTLPAAIVHCSKEFVSGLVHVALTRVPSCQVLLVLNFAPYQLVPPPTGCLAVCELHVAVAHAALFDCCWRHQLTDVELFIEYGWADDEGEFLEEDGDSSSRDEPAKTSVQDYFERGQEGKEDFIDLNTVFLMMSDDGGHFFQHLPQSFQATQMIQDMKIPQQYAESDYAIDINCVIDNLVTYNDEELSLFCRILWEKACHIIVQDIFDDPGQVRVTRQQ